MRLMLICGSSSGVGKTTLALELSRILPGSTVVKLGHGKWKRGKIKNFFTDVDEAVSFIESQRDDCQFMIVESNRIVGRIKADIVIYIENYGGAQRHDISRVKSLANVRIGTDANVSEWDSIIRGFNLPESLKRRVLGLFEMQHEFIVGNKWAVRTKVWFEREGKMVFGEGLARLLYDVDSHGSLSAAARVEGISYRHAWGDIKQAEERLGFQLLERQSGGAKGGGAKLTPEAHRLLEGYEILKRKVIRESDDLFKKTIGDMLSSE